MHTDDQRSFSVFTGMMRFMKPYMLMYIPGVLVYSAQQFVFPFISSVFLSRTAGAMLERDIPGVFKAGFLMIGMAIAALVLTALGVWLYVVSGLRAARGLKIVLFRNFMKTDTEASAATHSGEGIAVLNTDADIASQVYDNALSPLLSCVISIVFSAAVVFAVDYRLGLASVGIGVFALFAQMMFSGPLGKIGTKRLAVNTSAVRAMSDIFSGALTIRAFNRQEQAMESFEKENGKLLLLSLKQATIAMWQDFFTNIQSWLTVSGIFTLGGFLIATHRLDFSAFMMVPAMCMSLAAGMSSIGSAWAGMQAPLAAGKRILERLKGAPDGKPEPIKRGESEESMSEGQAGWDKGYALSVHLPQFTYRSADTVALADIRLSIAENEMVAFVGESGSGKSTLLRTVSGLYERNGLDMSMGGMRVDSVGIMAWRSCFAFVDQSCKLFDMSIAENISLGKPNRKPGEIQMDAIREAAAGAYADGFIQALPEGYDTQCGEKGAALSGGQKQRIAIARALIRKSPVLVFDEATSALDAESEKQVMETIRSLRGNHTVLFTTHQLWYAADADRIVVMDKGRIAEMGRHEELMEKKGLYHRLYTQGMKGA